MTWEDQDIVFIYEFWYNSGNEGVIKPCNNLYIFFRFLYFLHFLNYVRIFTKNTCVPFSQSISHEKLFLLFVCPCFCVAEVEKFRWQRDLQKILKYTTPGESDGLRNLEGT